MESEDSDQLLRFDIQPIHPDNEPSMRSQHSNIQTSVLFVNRRSRPVHLWWRNFQGQRVSYGVVQPGGTFDITTYVTHAWVITDEESGEALGIWNPAVQPGRVMIR
jgi:hypothetical protein